MVNKLSLISCASLINLSGVHLAKVHSPEFGAPFVKTGIAESVLAAELRNRHSGFHFLDKTDDLFFAESALLNFRPSSKADFTNF